MIKVELGGVYYNPRFKVIIRVTAVRPANFDYVVLNTTGYYRAGEHRDKCIYNSPMASHLMPDKHYSFYSQLINLK